MVTEFAELAGLLCHYRQEKGHSEARDHQKFIEWLEYHRHEEIKNLIVNAPALQKDVDDLLRLDYTQLMKLRDLTPSTTSEFLSKSSSMHKKPLTKEQVPTLMHFCYCNATELYEEASILKEKGKYARAFFLCAVAFEELAKIPIALNALFLPSTDVAAWRGFWRAFNSHGFKQGAANVYGQRILKTADKERWSRYYAKKVPINIPLNALKLASMYVDCYDGVAVRPNKLFAHDSRDVSSLFEIVKSRLDAWAGIHSTIDKSINVVRRSLELAKRMNFNGRPVADVIAEVFRKPGKK